MLIQLHEKPIEMQQGFILLNLYINKTNIIHLHNCVFSKTNASIEITALHVLIISVLGFSTWSLLCNRYTNVRSFSFPVKYPFFLIFIYCISEHIFRIPYISLKKEIGKKHLTLLYTSVSSE